MFVDLTEFLIGCKCMSFRRIQKRGMNGDGYAKYIDKLITTTKAMA